MTATTIPQIVLSQPVGDLAGTGGASGLGGTLGFVIVGIGLLGTAIFVLVRRSR